ncbi:hypothetical protein Scep_008644 [Stephania cephalantha]|uniref:Glycosyltransferase n=1 Tax=Stephania cephalantha TaxID=152367 RepID=A0AAP0PMX5_9MAGN
MDAQHHQIRVLMFPWLAHGHIFPFFELAKKLSQRNFSIYLCSTPINLSFIKEKPIHDQSLSSSIQFVELNLPPLPNLPPQNHTTKSLPPHLMPTLTTALDMAQPSFTKILTTLKPHLLIYDFIQPWAPEIASLHNITAVHFLTMGAFASSYFYHRCKKSLSDLEYPSPNMYLEEYEDQKLTQMLESFSNNILNKDRLALSIDRSETFVLIKTSRDVEEKYINHLSFIFGKEILPTGPLVNEEVIPSYTHDDHSDGNLSDEAILEWLSKKDKSSTVFVSFGSEYYMSKEEIEETAYGLELSEVNFIWVIRFPDHHIERVNDFVSEVLPQGFLERVGERGLVVENWAPQIEILKHSSIGGFVSHCGWSSVMEAMKFGVPIIAMPMHIDQPMNARLVVELGVGLEAKRVKGHTGDGEEGRIAREEVANVIREVIVEKEGEKVRRLMKEMSENMREQREEEIGVLVEKLLLHMSYREFS